MSVPRNYGIIRANPKANIDNFKKEPKDLDLPQGTDDLSATLVGTITIKGIKHSEINSGGITLFAGGAVALDASTKANLEAAVMAAIEAYEFNINITVSYNEGTDAFTFQHKGQALITDLVQGDDTELSTTRT